MRILHVIPSIDPASGGPVQGLKHFCSIYRMGGHEVEVASMDSPESVETFEFPAKVFGLGPSRGTYGYTRHAVPWLKANVSHYDIVLINCIWQYNAVAAYRALAGTGIPYAVFSHGMLDPFFKRQFPLKHLKKALYWHGILQRILRNASSVLFTCEEEKILARQSFSRYRVTETVIPYGTFGPDCDTTAAAEQFFTRWPHLRGKRLAIFLGRIHPKKATDILIEAFAATLAKDPAWHLVVAGPDQTGWQKDLESLADRLGVSHRITWTGMLTGAIKWGAFQASEIFVLPSHQENFGIVVAEAMACNLPVILSNKVNIWREVESYSAGLINEDTLEGTTASLTNWSKLTAEQIHAFRARSRKCFDELFDYKGNAKKVLDTIERLAHASRSFTASSPAEAEPGIQAVPRK
jgi:glycosyltransferase involved in cell wall biosynthesis